MSARVGSALARPALARPALARPALARPALAGSTADRTRKAGRETVIRTRAAGRCGPGPAGTAGLRSHPEGRARDGDQNARGWPLRAWPCRDGRAPIAAGRPGARR